MNFLAHILLAPDTEARVGALLGDFVTDSSEAEFGVVIHREILLHRKIDGFTDSHPVVLAAKSLFRPGTRRFAGILLDVFYDHLLARDWGRYCAQSLPEFVDHFYTDSQRFRSRFPADFARAFTYMAADDWLGSYREFAGVRATMQRIGLRRPKFAAPLVEGLADLENNGREIAETFPRFFADLKRYSEACRARATL
jgi:acyl carrier protein phosphodiesterase